MYAVRMASTPIDNELRLPAEALVYDLGDSFSGVVIKGV